MEYNEYTKKFNPKKWLRDDSEMKWSDCQNRPQGGKRASVVPANDEVSQVLSNIKAGNISHLKFDIGSSSDTSVSLNKVDVMNNSIDGNDGSFIKNSLENFSRNEQGSPVAKSCGLKASLDHSGMGDV
nr:hypothetical protein [Tanacetum cinerariifolium]